MAMHIGHGHLDRPNRVDTRSDLAPDADHDSRSQVGRICHHVLCGTPAANEQERSSPLGGEDLCVNRVHGLQLPMVSPQSGRMMGQVEALE